MAQTCFLPTPSLSPVRISKRSQEPDAEESDEGAGGLKTIEYIYMQALVGLMSGYRGI